MDFRRAARTVAISVAALMLIGSLPASTSAATIAGVAPRVILDFEGSLTRNPVIELIVIQAEGDTGTVVERRAANVPTTVDGVLSGGQDRGRGRGTGRSRPAPTDRARCTASSTTRTGRGRRSGARAITLKGRRSDVGLFRCRPVERLFFDFSTTGEEPDWHVALDRPRVIASTGLLGSRASHNDVAWFSSRQPRMGRLSFQHHDDDIGPGTYEAHRTGLGGLCGDGSARISRTRPRSFLRR